MNKNALKLNSVNVRHGTPIPTDSNANWERQPMTIYRRIYEQRFGPIPRDEDGRTYDIHHIDGNRKNNDPSNLVALSIKEHYKVHHDQGDWAACHRLAAKMNLSPEIISEMSRRNATKMAEENRHPFQGGHVHRRLAKEGKHPAQLRSAAGTNPFQDSEWKRKNALKLIEEGRHSSQTKKECPHCKGLFSITGFQRHVNICDHNPNKITNKYKTPEKKQCPHCLGLYDPGNYKQHHGENCKKRGK
jgi:hypothetical protein